MPPNQNKSEDDQPKNGPPKRERSVSDLKESELNTFLRYISHVVSRETSTGVSETHIMGSYARGEAHSDSDLDIRIVVQGWVSERDSERIESIIEGEDAAEYTPEEINSVDAHLTAAVPPESEPSVTVTS